ncbi:hypothetical protein HZA43_03645 [Candidatus Peregrinibacteria bacterium]|nr:hypothetical protein [Candidatus Peregrinibacteria bacterium]
MALSCAPKRSLDQTVESIRALLEFSRKNVSATTILFRCTTGVLGYKEALGRLVDELERVRADIRHIFILKVRCQIGIDPDTLIQYVRRVGGMNPPRLMNRLGVEIHHPLDRGFRLAYCLWNEIDPAEDVSPGAVHEFIQRLYDEAENAGACIERAVGILESYAVGMEGPKKEVEYLIARLRKVQRTSAANCLRNRGIHLRLRSEVIANTQFKKGNFEGSKRALLHRFERLASMSAQEREEARIELCAKKGNRYAGRRKDIEDRRRHHPYLSSVHHANLARILTRRGIAWNYRPDVFLIAVPEKEKRINERVLYFEPHFRVAERSYIVLVRSRKDTRRSRRPEENYAPRRIQVIRELMPAINIEVITIEEMERIMRRRDHGGNRGEFETLFRISIRHGERRTLSGDNIWTASDKFWMDEDGCLCGECERDRRQKMKEGQGRPKPSSLIPRRIHARAEDRSKLKRPHYPPCKKAWVGRSAPSSTR